MLKNTIAFGHQEFSYNFQSLWYQIANSRKHSKSRVLVNGSPKTGTTWMLRLITSVPGFRQVHNVNFHGEIQRYYEVLPGEVVHGHDQFTHQLWQILESREIKVILMIRDPRDQTVSRMFHIRRDINHAWHDRIQDMNDDEALMACIEGRPELPGTHTMISLTNSWLDEVNKYLPIKYEDLLVNPVNQLQRALNYLGVSASIKLVRAIVTRNSFERLSVGRKFWTPVRKPGQQNLSSHYRKGIAGDWKNYFKPAHIERYKELAGKALIEMGYEKDLDW